MNPSGFYAFSEFINSLDKKYSPQYLPELIKDFVQSQIHMLQHLATTNQLPKGSPQFISFEDVDSPGVNCLNFEKSGKFMDFELSSDYGWDLKFKGIPISYQSTYGFVDGNEMADRKLFTPEEEYTFLAFASDKGKLVLFCQYQNYKDPERDFFRAAAPKTNGDILRFFGKDTHAKAFYRAMKIPAFVEI